MLPLRLFIAQFTRKFFHDALPVALASVMGTLLLSHFAATDTKTAAAPDKVADETMVKMVRDEHHLIVDFLKQRAGQERPQKRAASDKASSDRALSDKPMSENATAARGNPGTDKPEIGMAAQESMAAQGSTEASATEAEDTVQAEMEGTTQSEPMHLASVPLPPPRPSSQIFADMLASAPLLTASTSGAQTAESAQTAPITTQPLPPAVTLAADAQPQRRGVFGAVRNAMDDTATLGSRLWHGVSGAVTNAVTDSVPSLPYLPRRDFQARM